ncbi:MAG: TetR/AcrR family transcriptional regulator [Mycobacterium leprae]
MARPTTDPSLNRRLEILQSAIAVLAEKGYDGASMAEIAKNVGISAPALYHHFAGKEELFLEAIHEHQRRVEALFQSAQISLDAPPADAVPEIVRRVLAILGHEQTLLLLRISLAEGPRHPNVAQAWETGLMKPVVDFVEPYFARQTALGRLRPAAFQSVWAAVMGSLVSTVIARDIMGAALFSGLDNDALAGQITQIVLHGLLAAQD